MANKITLVLEVDDKGSFTIATKEAKKTAKAVDGVTKSTKRLNRETSHHNKQQKGVAGATSNSTKAFSKMTTGMTGGLVPAYAVLAANIFAITAAFGALSRAAQFDILRKGLEFTGNAAGVNLGKVASGLRDITGAAVSAREAMSTVALGVSAGFDTKQLEGLTKVAKGASLALGRDMEDALSRLARGAAKLEPEILDELGIMVRLDDATETYAATIGKTADQLSQFERRQAFVNAIITQGELKFGALAEAIDASPYDQLSSAFKDIAQAGLELTNNVLGPIIRLLSEHPTALLGVLVLFGSTIVKAMIPSLGDMANRAKDAAKATLAMNKVHIQSVTSLTGVSKGVQVYQKKLAAGTAVAEDHTRATKAAGMSYVRNKADLDRLQESGGRFNKTWVRKRLLVANSTKTLNALTISTFRSTLAMTAQNEIQGLNLIQNGRTIAGWRILNATMKEQILIMNAGAIAAKGWGKANVFLTGTSKILGTALKGVGATIATWLPWIGLIVIGFSLLKDLILPLFVTETEAVTAALKEATEHTEQFAKTNKQLGDLLKRDTTTGISAYEATLSAMAGELQAGADNFTDVLDQLDIDMNTKLRAIAQKQAALQSVLASGDGGLAASALAKRLAKEEASAKKVDPDTLKQTVGLAEKQLSSLLIKIEKITKAGLTSASGIKSLQDQADTLATALENVSKKTVVNVEDLDELKIAYHGAADGASSLKAAMDGIGDIINDVQALFVTLDKPTGPFASRIELLDRMQKSLEDNSTVEAVNKMEAAFKKFGTSFEEFDGFVNTITLLNTELQRTKVVLSQAKASAASLKAAGGFLDQIEAEKTLQAAILDRQAILNRVLNEVALGDQERVNRQTELNVLQKLHADSIKKETTIILRNNVALAKREVEAVGRAKELLGIRKQIVAEIHKQAGLMERLAKLRAETRGAGTIEQGKQIQLEIQAASLKIEAAKTALDFTKRSVALELDLLRAKHQLMAAQFALSDNETTIQEQRVLDATQKIMELQGVLLQDRVATAKLELQVAKEQRNVIASNASVATGDTGSFTDTAMARDAGVRAIANAQKAADEKLAAAKQAVFDAKSLAALSNEETDRAAIKVAEDARDAAFAAAGAIRTLPQAFAEADMIGKVAILRSGWNDMIEDFKKMGPDGEVAFAIADGAMAITESFAKAFEAIEDGGSKVIAVLSVMSSVVSTISSIQQAQSKSAIAGIDAEIAAEKKRDGKSAQSLAKLSALENRKEKEKRKAFEQNKKMMMANAVINTAAGITMALATLPPPYSYVMAGITAVMGAAQLALISGTSYQGGGSASASGPTSVSVGERSNSVDVSKSRSPSGELGFFRGDSGTGTGATNFIPTGPGGFAGRATGGNVAFPVGEQGPELFIPERPGTVIPADEVANATGGAPLNVSFQISTIDSQGMEDALSKQRGNIIKMIREAANDHGQFFLEEVSTFDDEARL